MQTIGELHQGPMEIPVSITYELVIRVRVQRGTGPCREAAAGKGGMGRGSDQFRAVRVRCSGGIGTRRA